MGVGIVIVLLFLDEFFGYLGYQHFKDSRNNVQNAQKPTPECRPCRVSNCANFAGYISNRQPQYSENTSECSNAVRTHHFTDTQLYALPYPVCLFPDLRKKNEKLFLDAENDKTYSTPFELITQRKKDEATVDDDPIDETQVLHSCSDGWKRAPSVSVVMGSRAAATASV